MCVCVFMTVLGMSCKGEEEILYRSLEVEQGANTASLWCENIRLIPVLSVVISLSQGSLMF